MTGCTGYTDLAELLEDHGDGEQPAGNPVDAGIRIRPDTLSWSANPVTTLRPLASDLNVTARGRVTL